MTLTTIRLEQVRTDGGTQPRAEMNLYTVDEYAEALQEGAQFPPVVIFYDGADYWLADGFHRMRAAAKLGWIDFAADVRQGTRRDAVLFSVGANAEHGMRRTNEDKRRSIETLLQDEEWGRRSDNWVASTAKVSPKTVARVRSDYGIPKSDVRVGSDGRIINTANIGRPLPHDLGYPRLLPMTPMTPKQAEEPRDAPDLVLIDPQPKPRGAAYLTVDTWEGMAPTERAAALEILPSEKTFNRQDSRSIEWAQWSWNPVTGCRHDCPYCYARDIALRFYPQEFEPSILPERFRAPWNTRVPEAAAGDVAFKNVFTCSMADLFGRWVPREWIETVIGIVRANPQWNFLFLTKFPKRYAEFEFPVNAWLGTSVDCQARVKNAEDAFAKIGGGTKWLSVEPLLQPLKFTRLNLFDWVVVGGASASTQTPAWVPPIDWIADLHQQARGAGCRIYYKDNCGMEESLRIREFPWSDPPPRELPESFRYLAGLK